MMALSQKDKEEIADMLNKFSEGQGRGRPLDRFVYDFTTGTIFPMIESGAQRFIDRPRGSPGDQLFAEAIETVIVPSKRNKAMSKFNKAIKEGMKMVRASNQYGKRGSITNSKKVFGMVAKTVSRARKGAKLPKKGVLRKIGSYARGLFK